VGDEARAARVRDEARVVGRGWSGPDAAPTWRLTAALFAGLADDDALSDLAAAIPPERLPPLLFIASVHYLVAQHRGEAFAAYFPVPGGDQPPLDDAFAARYRDFCLEHRDELGELFGQRVYQMNEVARCVQVTMALGLIGRRHPGRELALVDMGTGSGLALYLDQYRYALSDGTQWGPEDSAVRIECKLQGARRPARPTVPPIGHRIGIDLNPLDLDDAGARAWLTACTPPEAGALRRLSGAMEVARAGRAPIIRGSADRHLAEVLRAGPAELLPVVVDSYTAVFFDPTQLTTVREAIASLGDERDVAWISLDPLIPLGTRARDTVQGGAAPSHLVEQNRRGGVFAALSLTSVVQGHTTTELLAAAHPSGTQMEWLDSTSSR
jgi:hypothetical protein